MSLSNSRSLMMADPDWLQRQRIACGRMGVSLGVLAAADTMMIVGTAFADPGVWIRASVVPTVIAVFAMLLAWWRLGVPQPNQPPEENVIGRFAARLVVTTFVLIFLTIVVSEAAWGRELSGSFVSTLILTFLAVAVQAACLDRAGMLMERSQQRRVCRWISVGGWASAVTAVLLLAGCVAVPIAIRHPLRTPGLYFWIGYLLVLSRLSIFITLLWRVVGRHVEADRLDAVRSWTSD